MFSCIRAENIRYCGLQGDFYFNASFNTLDLYNNLDATCTHSHCLCFIRCYICVPNIRLTFPIRFCCF